jgi:hypothetical protein
VEGGDVTQLDILQQKQWHRLIPKNIGVEEGAYCRQVRVEGGDVTQLKILQQKQCHRLIPENIGLEEGA